MRPASAVPACAVLALVLACASSLEKARVASNSGDEARAEQLLRKSIAKDPEDKSAAQRELAELRVKQAQRKAKDDPAGAEKLVREALQLHPGDPKALDLLGRVVAAQGRRDEAIQILGGEGVKCDLCDRYLSVLLLERAAKHEAEGTWEQARADYARAGELVPDASTQLAVARCSERMKDEEGTFAAVEKAVPLIGAQDTAAQAEFTAMRERAVLAAAQRGDVAAADRWLGLFPPNAGGDAWYVLQLRVAQELYRQKKADVAVSRAQEILGPKHTSALPETRKAEFERFLADVHRLQGAELLRAGKPGEADERFKQAMEVAPKDDRIKLLRALAIAGEKEVSRGLQVVQALPKETKGHAEVLAILESMVVAEKLAAGDEEGARAALARAQAASAETPEVHVAIAELLVVTPVPGLKKNLVKQLRKTGLIQYPGDTVNRYGEALSELAWAREQARGLGEGYLFRGPGTEKRMDDLERKIRTFFPFPVEFNADATAILKIRFKSGSAGEVSVKAGDSDLTVSVPAGREGGEAVLREPGLTYLRVGGRTSSFVTEPYTKVTIEL